MKNQILLFFFSLFLFNCSQKDFNAPFEASNIQNIYKEVKQLSLGYDYSCTLTKNGDVKCWGWNAQGQLGQGHTNNLGDGLSEERKDEMGDNLSTIDLGKDFVATEIATGFGHICALLNTNEVKCWGRNDYGQLGQGHTNHLGDGLDESGESEMGDNLPVIDLGTNVIVKAIVAGQDYSCALINDGDVKCWGWNGYGQLGQGHDDNIGDDPSEMGDNLPTIDLGEDVSVKAIAAGYLHVCVLLNTDEVKCWGSNFSGQLGQGHRNPLGDGLNGSEESEMGDNLLVVDLGEGVFVQTVVAGGLHTCTLLNTGKVKCWGSNSSGQLGLGHVEHLGDGFSRSGESEMGDNLLTIDFGVDAVVKDITAGYRHNCVLLGNDQIKCWGKNSSGQLGQGHTDQLGDGFSRSGESEIGDDLPPIDLGEGLAVKSFVAGGLHTCAALSNEATKCWGDNSSGQLGQGHGKNLGDNVNEGGRHEMGENLLGVDLGT